jgi:hypothetical protein
MNKLVLKTIVYDANDDRFHSPSQKDFIWTREVTVAKCFRGCKGDDFNPNCTCGIYASPNPAVITEYVKYPNSVYVLLNTLGWCDIWSAPDDVGPGLITRSWGVQIIGVVTTEPTTNGFLSPQRYLCSVKVLEHFRVNPYPWAMARLLIQASWNRPESKIKDPYDPRQWENLEWDG